MTSPRRIPSRRVSARHRDQTGDVQSSFLATFWLVCTIAGGSILFAALITYWTHYALFPDVPQ